jgi:hypothetical protein
MRPKNGTDYNSILPLTQQQLHPAFLLATPVMLRLNEALSQGNASMTERYLKR